MMNDAMISINTGIGCLRIPREHQRQQGHEQQLLPRHDGEPVEEAPPQRDHRTAQLVQGLPGIGGLRPGLQRPF